MKLITNGKIVLEEKVIEGYNLVIEGIRIKDIIKDEEITKYKYDEIINAYGGYIMPGFIDVHSDYVEHMIAPRSGSTMNFDLALYEFEKECCAHGITTMFHSVSIMNQDEKKTSKPMREKENVEKLMDTIENTHSTLHLIHNRFHMRFEISAIKQYAMMLEFLKAGKIHLISFMDHTPGQGQYKNLEVYKNYLAFANDMTLDEADKQIREKMLEEKITIDKIKEAGEIARKMNVAIASHDDDTLEKLDMVQGFGSTIAEFPITLEVAQEAKKRGMLTVLGAPNVLLGGSHSGNLSARVAIENDACDILTSDYYPSSLLHAIYMMKDKGQDMAKMVAKVTINPARATKIDSYTGSIEKGKIADLIIVIDLPNKLPGITHVFVNGECIQETHYRV